MGMTFRIVALALLVFSLSACGGDGDSAEAVCELASTLCEQGADACPAAVRECTDLAFPASPK